MPRTWNKVATPKKGTPVRQKRGGMPPVYEPSKDALEDEFLRRVDLARKEKKAKHTGAWLSSLDMLRIAKETIMNEPQQKYELALIRITQLEDASEMCVVAAEALEVGVPEWLREDSE